MLCHTRRGSGQLLRVALLGTCLAHADELDRALGRAIARQDYDGLTELPGSYAVIIEDGERLLLAGDVAGLHPMYYACAPGYLVYSSSALAIARLRGLDLDRSWLAVKLLFGDLHDLIQRDSPFSSVSAVPAGYWLDAASARVGYRRFWHLPEPALSADEAASRLRTELVTSVGRRVALARRPTSDLSGGLDSTSISLLAATSLAAGNRDLVTLTRRSGGDVRNEDFRYASAAIEARQNIRPLILEHDDLPSVFSDLQSVPVTGEPGAILCGVTHIRANYAGVRREGSDLHLDGEGGDAVLQGRTPYLADLVSQNRWSQLRSHARGWAHLLHVSPFRLTLEAVRLSRVPYADWLGAEAEKLSKGGGSTGRESGASLHQPLGWSTSPRHLEWFSPEARELTAERIRAYAALAETYSSRRGQHNSLLGVFEAAGVSRLRQQVAALRIESPYLDRGVVEASLSARPDQATDPYRPKPLLVKALQRDVPEVLLRRRDKGGYRGAAFGAFHSHLKLIERVFADSALQDLGLVDIVRLRSGVATFADRNQECDRTVIETLGAELWLRAMEASVTADNPWTYSNATPDD